VTYVNSKGTFQSVAYDNLATSPNDGRSPSSTSTPTAATTSPPSTPTASSTLLCRLFPPGRMSRPRRSRQQPSLLAHPLQQRLVRPTCTATTSKRTGATACAPSVTATTGSTSSYRRAMTAPSTSLPRPTGSTNTKAAGESSVRWEGNHPKIVHHFDNSGGGTHAFRFAKLGRRQD